MRIVGPVALLALLAAVAISDTPIRAEPAARVYILGFDGMDPEMADRLIAEGKLPHLAWMKEHGAMRRLATTNPAQSPVAWSAFSTGMNPGKTRIFDFLRRNPYTYYPDFSTVTIQRGKFAFGFLPTKAPTITNNRKGTTFWQIASTHGVRTAVLEAPINFPPEKLQNGVLLSGLGVPDIRGTMGTFSFWATNATGVGDTEMGGKVARIRLDKTGRAVSVIHGPRNPLAKRDAEGRIPDITLPVEFQRIRSAPPAGDAGSGKGARPAVRIAVQGRIRTVRQGEWSDWYPIQFTVAPLVTLRGIARFHVVEAYPEMRVYLSPINFDPRRPPVPISGPPAYSAELARRNGLYKTLGWPEDTWALNEEAIDERIFLEDLNFTFDRQRALVLDALHQMNPDLFVSVFQSTDKVQHMFWRLIDPKHPMYSRQAGRAVRGRDRPRLHARRQPRRDTSRELQGWAGRPPCRLRPWIFEFSQGREHQHLARAERLHDPFAGGPRPGPESGGPVRPRHLLAERRLDQDARLRPGPRTDLREPQGTGTLRHVAPGAEYDSLRSEIVRRFGALRDPDTGEAVVRHVYKRDEIYNGPYFNEAPDMVVGFERGYRVSWQTSLGGIPPQVIEPNERRWSADHCSVDPSEVPGVFFSSRPIESVDARIMDVAPTVLRRLGIEPPAGMDGKDLGLR